MSVIGTANVLNRLHKPCRQCPTKDLRFLLELHRPRRIVCDDLNRRFERRHHDATCELWSLEAADSADGNTSENAVKKEVLEAQKRCEARTKHSRRA